MKLLHTDSSQQKIGITIVSKNTEIVAEVGTDIRFEPNILDTFHYDGWRPLHYDLLMVTAAVGYADRRFSRGTMQWKRQFQITVPVFELEVWKQPEVQRLLCKTLNHLTGDNWKFKFVKFTDPNANTTLQRMLPLHTNKKLIMAYSDGLDSRCVSGLLDNNDSAIRIRVTKNKERVKSGELPFEQIPFVITSKDFRESSGRSRSFKFSAVTAIAGHISGVRRIIVPESGQGSLGPALLTLHKIYPDYRNYPKFFRNMEEFIEKLLDFSVYYEQPRLWYTKAETINEYLNQSETRQESNLTILSTRSCWQRRWNAAVNGTRRQCGLCVACLLRRMSLHTVGINEPKDTYKFSNLQAEDYQDAIVEKGSNSVKNTMIEYGVAGANYLQRLADRAYCPDARFRSYAFELAQVTGLSELEAKIHLKSLLKRHAIEWNDFIDAQGKCSFIRRWTKGVNNG